MSIAEWVFYFFGGVAVIAAFSMLFNKNVLYNAFFLLLSFLAIAALYVFAGADFIAVTQIMVYVGGILVLLIFGVMFTSRQKAQKEILVEHGNILVGTGLALSTFALLAWAIWQTDFSLHQATQTTQSVDLIGKGLLTTYLVPFELAAILLLAALIGAAIIAWKGSLKSSKPTA